MHALGRIRVDAADEILVQRLAEERQHRRQQPCQCNQRGVERGIGRTRVAVVGAVPCAPEAPARAPHVPVREIVEERLDLDREAACVVRVEPGARRADKLVKPRQQPQIKGIFDFRF